MDNHIVQNNQIKGYETVRFEDFQNIVTRVEQLEAENKSLSTTISVLKDQNCLFEAKLVSLESRLGTFDTKSQDQKELHQISAEAPMTPGKRKLENYYDDLDDSQFIETRAATPQENSPHSSGDQELESQDLPSEVLSHVYMKLIQDIDFSTDDILLIPTFKAITCEIPIFDDIELDYNSQPKVTHKYVVIIGENGAHLGTGYRLPSWAHGRGPLAHLDLQQKQAFDGSVLEMKTHIKQKSGRRIRKLDNASRRQRRNAPNHPTIQSLEHQALPKYIYELGELFIRSYSHVKGTEEAIRSTGCHLVVDICSKSKAMWLVYRYKGVEKFGSFPAWKKRKFDRDEDMFKFVQGDQGFDVCQVAEGMRYWVRGDGTFGHVHNAQSLIKSTRCRADPEFATPVFEEFLEELNKDSVSAEGTST